MKLTMDSTLVPENLRITWQDAYNRLRKRMLSLSRLDDDGKKSLEKWATKLRSEGFLVLFERVVSAKGPDHFAYVFAMVSPWQQQVTKQTSRLVQH